MNRIIRKAFSAFFSAAIILTGPAFAADPLTLATTTSTYDSGLLDVLIPAFEKVCGCKVKIISVGTGQAVRTARDGNADVVLVHDRATEEQFVKDGFGVKRHDVMYNDYVLVGPKSDPAKIKGQADITKAFGNISMSKANFASRSDDSGTHKKELSLWKRANLKPEGKWYLQVGSGMIATLRVANEKGAYCLTDRGTWLAHEKELKDLSILVEKDEYLKNNYSVIAVSKEKHPKINAAGAELFVKFITGPDGQKIIADFGVKKYGQPLFFPDADKK